MKKSELKEIAFGFYTDSDDWENVFSEITQYDYCDFLANAINTYLDKMSKQELLFLLKSLEVRTGKSVSEISKIIRGDDDE